MSNNIKELIEQIQNEAVDSNSDLGSLLRKCKILASKLGSQLLEDWLIWESNGYPQEIEVPIYRKWSLQLRGHIIRAVGSGFENIPIPLSAVPKENRDLYANFQCRQSIASIEETINNSADGLLRVTTGDLAALLSQKNTMGCTYLETWAETPRGNFIEVINSVRNRILDFVLAVGKEELIDEASSDTEVKSIESSKVNQIFNTYILGGAANIVGNATNSSIEINIQTGDFSSLRKLLKENGLESSDMDELEKAIEEDDKPSEKGRFGGNVSKWISKMVEKAANGSWQIGIGAAGSLLANAISKFYGG